MIKTPVTNLYDNARKHFQEGRFEDARNCADMAIINIANKVKKGGKDEDLVEGTTIRLWYERLWYFLEKNGLLLGQDIPEDIDEMSLPEILIR